MQACSWPVWEGSLLQKSLESILWQYTNHYGFVLRFDSNALKKRTSLPVMRNQRRRRVICMCRHQQSLRSVTTWRRSSPLPPPPLLLLARESVSAARSMKWEELEAGGDIHPAMIHFSHTPSSMILEEYFLSNHKNSDEKNIEKEHSVTCYPCNIRHLYTQPYSKSEKALNCR